MSIGVERVNGGVIGGQWTEGSLSYFIITGPANAFNGSFALTPTEKGPRPAPRSAAEAVYQVLSGFGTTVIFEIVSSTEIHVAVAYGEGFVGVDSTGSSVSFAEDALQALGTAVYKRFGLASPGALNAAVTADGDALRDTASLDFSSATVLEVPFELVDPS